MLEWHWLDRPHWDELLIADAPIIQDGHIAVPDRPGIGFELNDEAARRYAREGAPYFA